MSVNDEVNQDNRWKWVFSKSDNTYNEYAKITDRLFPIVACSDEDLFCKYTIQLSLIKKAILVKSWTYGIDFVWDVAYGLCCTANIKDNLGNTVGTGYAKTELEALLEAYVYAAC